MSERRRSKRTSAVTKGRLLEEKLEKRRINYQERAEKARFKQIQSSKEESHAENLAIDNQINENFDDEEQVDKSLEWDHSEDTPPSFSNETWDSNQTVDEIIHEIQNLNSSENSDTGKEKPLDKEVKPRRQTSTDNAFLDSGEEPIPPLNLWPPRFPSQEPEFNPLLHSSLAKDPREAASVTDFEEDIPIG